MEGEGNDGKRSVVETSRWGAANTVRYTSEDLILRLVLLKTNREV